MESTEAHPETRLERNRSGRWEIRWTERLPNGRARTRSASCHTKDEREAKAYRDAWLAAREVIAHKPTLLTIAELIDEYMKLHVTANGKAATQDWSLRPIKRHLGFQTVLSLTEQRLLWYRVERRKERPVSDSTLRRELGALQAVLNWAVKKKVLPEGTKLPDIDLPPEGMARENYLEEAEEERIWQAAAGYVLNNHPIKWRVGLFVCLALETASRRAAIEGLTWDRVNFKGGFIEYRDPRRKATKKRRVPVPISDRLDPILRHAFNHRTNQYVLGSAGSIRTTFESFVADHKAYGSAGELVTAHDLRRTWATLRAQWGVPLWEIAGVLGDTLATTEAHYARHSPGHLRSAVNTRGPRA